MSTKTEIGDHDADLVLYKPFELSYLLNVVAILSGGGRLDDGPGPAMLEVSLAVSPRITFTSSRADR